MRKHTLPFVTSVLASLAGIPAWSAETPPPTLTPAQNTALDELGKGGASKAAMEAEGKYLEARALYQAARFVEAREVIEEAIRIYPQNEAAQQLREDILGVLSLRENRLQMVTTWLHSIQDVKTQEIAVRMSALLASGDKKMAASDFAGAELDYDRVDISLRSFPYQFDWGNLTDVVAGKKLEARAQARRAELERQRGDRGRAEDVAQQKAAIEETALRAKVDEMLRRARLAYDRKDYKRAEVDAWNAYELDRRREDARELYLSARREGHVLFDDTYREERLERIARVHEEIHKALIPQSELLVYPEDWSRRSLRKARELGTNKVEPWMATIRDRLEQRVTFEFEDTGFEDVVNFFRQVTGVNIITAPEIYAAGGGGTVTLKAKDMKFGDALKWVLQLTNLHMAIQNQAIFISNAAVTGAVVLRMYDVSDLISPVRDFPGRELAYTSSGGKGGKAGGFDLFAAAPMGGDKATDPQVLVDFIQKNVAPGTWDKEGVGIEQRAGSTLFISQNPEVHGLVEQLLGNLRNQSALQVHVNIRLLDVKKGFFEEIGVEYTNTQAVVPNTGLLAGSSPAGFARLNPQDAYAGSLNSTLPANATQANYTAGTGGVYNRGLQVEGSYNIGSFIGQTQVNAVLSAAEEETDTQIVQHPALTCFNGQRAHADFMTQYAYIADYEIVNNNYDPQIQVLNFGDVIDVRPVVSSDRKYITLEVRPSSVLLIGVFIEIINGFQIIGAGGGIGGGVVIPAQFPLELPNVLVRTLRSTVMLPDKGNLLLGGFQNSLRQRTHSGIPFLSHIPFLGRLFGRNGTYDENRRLFFLLNAEIIDLSEKEALQ